MSSVRLHNIAAVVISSLILVVFFQNCSKSNFNSASSSLQSGNANAGSGQSNPTPIDSSHLPFISKPTGTFASTGPTVSPTLAGHAQAKGVLIRIKWSDLEPTPGQFDFSALDSNISVVTNAGKDWSLGVLAGQFAPSWIYSSPYNVASMNLTFRGSPVSVPKFWDTNLENRLQILADALAAKYSSNAKLRLVYLPQMTLNGVEGHFNGITASTLDSFGYTDQLWVDSILKTTDIFRKAFSTKPIAIELHYLHDSMIAPQAIMNAILTNAELKNQVGITIWWISGNTTYQPLLLDALKVFTQNGGTGYAQLINKSSETTSFPNGDYTKVFEQAAELGIKYIEPWDADFNLGSWDNLFAAFNSSTSN